MKSLRIILFIFLFSNLCFAQTGWYQVSSGTNKNLNSVCFINLNTGFAVGENGMLLKTVTTGTSWDRINLNDTNFFLSKVYFKDQNTGFILGHSSINSDSGFYTRIYKSTNGGNNWNIDQARINDVWLNSIEFINSNIGFISGGLYSLGDNKFLKTTNGGMSWVEIETGFFSFIRSKRFINENTGFLGGQHSIYKTTNSGINWNEVYQIPNSSNFGVSEIVFIDNNIGFAAGGIWYPQKPGDTIVYRRFILKTTDSGDNWNFILNNSGSIISSLTVINESILYASGFNEAVNPGGFIIKTSNGGANWNNETLPFSIALSDVKNNNVKGFSVGSNGTIFKKDNIVSVTQISTVVPSSINLYQNYPNPFNPETSIKFDISKSGFISLKVFDITGKEMKNLFEGVKEAGSYQLKFDGANLNSGVYFYKLMTNGSTITKSMVLVK